MSVMDREIHVDKHVTSADNAVFQTLRDCLATKGIRKHGQFLVAGERAVAETLQRFPEHARSLVLCEQRHLSAPDRLNASDKTSGAARSTRDLISRAREWTRANEPRFSVIALARPLFDELDAAGTRSPLLLVRTPEIPAADLSLAPQGIEILCAMGDPANVGALLRSAAAFGASRVVLLQESASPFHPKAVRAASATTLLTPLVRGPSIHDVAALGKAVALDMRGQNLATFRWPINVRLLVGEEGLGVPASTAFTYLAIPMMKGVESLNAAVAASLALHSYRADRVAQETLRDDDEPVDEPLD